MIGDKLRAEFDEYFAEQEKAAGAGKGMTKSLFRGDYVKKFMVIKRINLVDDPAGGNLKSVFILRVGEKKLIDGRARGSLAPRFEYKNRKDSEGNKLDPIGFIKFKLVEGEEESPIKAKAKLQIGGKDLDFFEEEPEPEVEKVEKEVVRCKECGKEFDSTRALSGHMLSHRKKVSEEEGEDEN